MEHVPVLREVVQKYLDLSAGDIVVDGTLGLGGHAKDSLERIGKSGKLLAFDQDERNLAEAKKRLASYKDQIVYFHDNFRYLKTRVTGEEFSEVDAILLDLGLSSPHVDEPERGFSFMNDGPLDMRFDQRGGKTAADVLNTYPEEVLMNIFFKYGEEKMSRKIAGWICERREKEPFSSTVDLAKLVERAIPRKRSSKKSKSHPATQVFQALRIEVNDEFAVLEEVLAQSMEILKIGGRIVVISYHSMEDRIVKQFFKALLMPKASTEQSVYSNYADPIVEALTKKPVIPTEEEILRNPRSRSAKLRAYKKILPYKFL